MNLASVRQSQQQPEKLELSDVPCCCLQCSMFAGTSQVDHQREWMVRGQTVGLWHVWQGVLDQWWLQSIPLS